MANKLWGVITLEEILSILERNPIIAAIRNDNDINEIINSQVGVVFILNGSLLNLKKITNHLKSCGKKVCIHVDLIDGLGKDHTAVDFLKQYIEPDGIITTKTSLAKHSKQIGLFTILRLFIIDSYSLTTGIKNIQETMPDAVEVMPGIASKLVENVMKDINVPIIAGGLVSTKEDIISALSSGAFSVSTSCSSLWDMR